MRKPPVQASTSTLPRKYQPAEGKPLRFFGSGRLGGCHGHPATRIVQPPPLVCLRRCGLVRQGSNHKAADDPCHPTLIPRRCSHQRTTPRRRYSSRQNLLREARRQKSIPAGSIPEVCVLDPDGDIVRAVRADGRGRHNPFWACYHTDMVDVDHAGQTLGIVGCAVGAPFAVLVAEQMFASGCRLLISVTSAGRIGDAAPDASFILIDRALRDEGTSLHYRPASRFADGRPCPHPPHRPGADPPPPHRPPGCHLDHRRPVPRNRSRHRSRPRPGVLAVEMEAAALYAFAEARRQPVICFAHVTNQMAQVDGDFEKGEANGATDALNLIAATAAAWRGAP